MPSLVSGDPVVVGAGYAGLAAALRLRDHGYGVTVVEARERLGGRVWSVPCGGEAAELGGEWIFEGYDELRSLAARFGLTLAPTAVDFGRREATDADAPLDAQDALLLEIASRARSLPPDELAAATIAGFLDGWPASPALAALRARLQGTCAADLAGVALEPALTEGLLRPGGAGRSWRLAGGNQALADAMAGEIGDVRRGSAVTRIEQRRDEVLVGGEDLEVVAPAAVVAVPIPILRELAFDPPMPEVHRSALASIGFGSASKLAVLVRGELEPGAWQRVREPFWWWVTGRPGGERSSIVSAFAGSRAALDDLAVAGGDASTWLERLVAAGRGIVPAAEPLLAVWDEDPFARGAYTALPPWASAQMPVLAEPFGRVILAGEHTAGVSWHGTMEGALRSGSRAAERVLRMLAEDRGAFDRR